MIYLNENTSQDFLNREWAERISKAGIDMSNSRYIIGKDAWAKGEEHQDDDIVWFREMEETDMVYDVIPTLTIAELYAILEHNSSEWQKADYISKENNIPIIEALATVLLQMA